MEQNGAQWKKKEKKNGEKFKTNHGKIQNQEP